ASRTSSRAGASAHVRLRSEDGEMGAFMGKAVVEVRRRQMQKAAEPSGRRGTSTQRKRAQKRAAGAHTRATRRTARRRITGPRITGRRMTQRRATLERARVSSTADPGTDRGASQRAGRVTGKGIIENLVSSAGMTVNEAAHDRARGLTLVTAAGSAVFTVLLFGGYAQVGSELALAQAADSLLDCLALGVLAWTVRVARTPADAGHPFGHAPAEPIGALVTAVFAGVLGLE